MSMVTILTVKLGNGAWLIITNVFYRKNVRRALKYQPGHLSKNCETKCGNNRKVCLFPWVLSKVLFNSSNHEGCNRVNIVRKTISLSAKTVIISSTDQLRSSDFMFLITKEKRKQVLVYGAASRFSSYSSVKPWINLCPQPTTSVVLYCYTIVPAVSQV